MGRRVWIELIKVVLINVAGHFLEQFNVRVPLFGEYVNRSHMPQWIFC